MNPDEELVYEVDEDDRILRIVRRGELTDQNLRHRSVAILFRDGAGRVLVHRRAEAKRVFPRLYDMFVAGMVQAGESYDKTARREAAEEVGQRNVVLRPIGKWRYDDDKVPQWATVYTAKVTGPVVPQPEEVEWFGFLTEAELVEKIATEDFCPDSLWLWRRLRREPEPEPGQKAERKSKPEADSEPEPRSEPTSKSEPESEPEAEPERKSKEAESKPEPKSEVKPESESKSEPKPEPKPEPESKPESRPESRPEPKPKSEPGSEPDSQPKSE